VHSALHYSYTQEPVCHVGAVRRGAGEEERRRSEGTREGTKDGARAGGGKATGAWVIVIGGQGKKRHPMDCGCDGSKGLALWHGVDTNTRAF
jgi:hypothetical protein